MIFHCPACRELPSAEHAVVAEDGKRAGVLCPSCGEVAWLPVLRHAPAPSEAAQPRRAAPVSRPSDALPAADEGLVALLRETPAQGPVEEPLVKDLIALAPRWSDYDAHRALLRRANAAGALPALGLRYRRVLQARPGDEVAQRAQQEIVTLAMASLSTMPGAVDPAATMQRGQVAALVLVLVLVTAVVAFLLFILRGF